MQLIETTDLGVRSVVITLRKPGSRVVFVLFPMLHVGERTFYWDVAARLNECDLVVAEGSAAMPSPLERLFARLRVGDLVDQLEVLHPRSFHVPVVWPDIGETWQPELREHCYWSRWRTEPLWSRVIVASANSVAAVGFLLRGRYRFPSKPINISTEHYTARDPLAADDRGTRRRRQRDERLVRALADIARAPRGQIARQRRRTTMVGVVYGAAHMPAVIDFLCESLGYVAAEAEWLTIRSYANRS
ncbi:hypothetical protein [Nonomuraea sp. B1E8]|uniref:hypothetical protein n=1 Tax=unclassified Nonomuraea TaxID=2593643 RepID=UPI00325E6E0C